MRFSLKTLLLAWVFAAISLAAIAVKYRQYHVRRELFRKQQAAASEIWALGGTVATQDVVAIEPTWLANALRLAPFKQVIAVQLDGGRPSRNAVMVHLRELPDVEKIEFGCANVSDGGLVHLRNVPRLSVLDLSQNRNITDEGLGHLSSLKNLENVDLGGTGISDNGVVHLVRLPKLHKLGLSHTAISDSGLGPLAKVRTLRELDVSGTLVTDGGLSHLTRLESLEVLDISATHVTDEGIEHLCSMRKLRQLILDPPMGKYAVPSSVTPNGVSKLQRVRPDLTIIARRR